MAEYAIKLEKVKKDYPLNGGSVHALKGIDLEVKKGDYVAIMGPSGSGKSTLLHIIGCLDVPTHGKYYLDGIDVTSLSDNQLAEIRRDKIGFVFQAFNLMPNLTALENVMLPMLIAEKDEDKSLKRAKELLSIVGLKESMNHKINQLSGGEKQRVALARAMSNNPAFILADEPTGNLDSKTSSDVMSYIHKLWDEYGITIVIVTHEPVVAKYSNRIIMLKDGIVEQEMQHEVFHNHINQHYMKIK